MAFFSQSALTLNNVVIENNQSPINPGGGLYFRGYDINASLNLNNVTIRNNRTLDTYGQGGGLYIEGGIITLNNVTLNGNRSGSLGGGLYASEYYDASAVLQMTNVTIYDNEAQISGGGIYLNYANIYPGLGGTIETNGVNITLANNRAINGSGGNIYNNAASLSLKNSLIANGTANGSPNNCDGNPLPNITSLGYNLDSGNTCELVATGDITNINPLLAASLADNGGSTETLALAAALLPLTSAVSLDHRESVVTSARMRPTPKPTWF